jgi:hypothetical protein
MAAHQPGAAAQATTNKRCVLLSARRLLPHTSVPPHPLPQRRYSVAKIETSQTYEKGRPKLGGLSDPRMGTMDRALKCTTDGNGVLDCPGYFGHIELAKPMFHVHFLKTVVKVLRCVSYHNSRIMVEPVRRGGGGHKGGHVRQGRAEGQGCASPPAGLLSVRLGGSGGAFCLLSSWNSGAVPRACPPGTCPFLVTCACPLCRRTPSIRWP